MYVTYNIVKAFRYLKNERKSDKVVITLDASQFFTNLLFLDDVVIIHNGKGTEYLMKQIIEVHVSVWGLNINYRKNKLYITNSKKERDKCFMILGNII